MALRFIPCMNPFHWTKDELAAEWRYRREERIGILCGSATPTPEQEALARAEADEAVRRLREEQ